MRLSFIKFIALFALTIMFAVASFAQNGEKAKRNNPFAPSPRSRTKTVESQIQPKTILIEAVASNGPTGPSEAIVPPKTIGRETFEIAKRVATANVSPLTVYRVGVGDVLFIEIQNGNSSSSYYTVRPDGTIDFPLAGEDVAVTGQTADEIEESLTNAVKLYEKPRIAVKVREYASHSVLVTGLVEAPGSHQLQRDALPFFVIRAAAIVSPRASGVRIIREKNAKVESFLLADKTVNDVLVYPGDLVEFTGSTDALKIVYYFIGGDISTSGKKDLSTGLTLSKAIIASAGAIGNVKKASIRRRNEAGVLVSIEYDLKGIKAGKSPDPVINQDDIVELGK